MISVSNGYTHNIIEAFLRERARSWCRDTFIRIIYHDHRPWLVPKLKKLGGEPVLMEQVCRVRHCLTDVALLKLFIITDVDDKVA